MAHYRSAHPTAPGTISQQPLPGHHPTSAAPRPGHAHAAGSKPQHRTPGQSATIRATADKLANSIYLWRGKFDRIKLREGFIREFGKSPNFNTAAIPHMELLVSFMENDARIVDLRWMAYMLATAYWETTSLQKETVPGLDRHHKPMLDKKGRPLVHSRQRWRVTMSPVEEVGHGAGRNYSLPVKVKALPKGDARVTEQDGDQFMVTTQGNFSAITAGARQGVPATGKATRSYQDDDGNEFAYYGRGYVQLTWWSNYAKASVQLKLGLQLLLHPDDVLQPETAYKVMAHGMLTGQGFANGRKFSTYFHGTRTDYVNARRMVNGTDHAISIAHVAQRFEAMLTAAKS